MIKGCQRKTIRLKDTDSRFYEEAYFVLRPGVERDGVTDSDMIKEALRIVGEGAKGYGGAERRTPVLRRAAFFAAGALFGASFVAALFLVF